MESTAQKSTKGGGSTNMGNFIRVEYIDVEPLAPGEDGTDGEALDTGATRKLVLKYENGQQCWNGPMRSTSIVLSCSEESKMWKVVEEEKCVYRIEGGNPAACLGEADGKTDGANSKDKDEL
jgi:protein kinase C substrate 80K-H